MFLAPFLFSSCSTANAPATISPVADASTELRLAVRKLTLENQDLQFRAKRLQDRLAPGGIYIIRPGDTFSGIAGLFSTRVDKLSALNPDLDPAQLKVGMPIRVKDDPMANQPPEPTQNALH